MFTETLFPARRKQGHGERFAGKDLKKEPFLKAVLNWLTQVRFH